MAIFYHYLIQDKYHKFFKQNRMDPILKEKFKEYDKVVICSNCKSAFRLDIWILYYKEKHCEQSNGDTEEYLEGNRGNLYSKNSLYKFKKIYIFYILSLAILILSVIFYTMNKSRNVVDNNPKLPTVKLSTSFDNKTKLPTIKQNATIDNDKNIEKKILYFINYWNKSINTNPKQLNSIYLENLLYFGIKKTNSYVALEQEKILQKYPKFYQNIKNIKYYKISKYKYKILFNRFITLSKKYKLKKLSTYLVVVNINNKFRVSSIGGNRIDINSFTLLNNVNNINYLKEAIRLYYNNKNYVKSKEYFERAAKEGNTEAYRYLGVIYLFAQGVKKNKKKAIYWLKKAIKNNDSRAQDIYNKYIN